MLLILAVLVFACSLLMFSFYVAALLTCAGMAVYPVGWDNREVRESCGVDAQAYRLGKFRMANALQLTTEFFPYLCQANLPLHLLVPRLKSSGLPFHRTASNGFHFTAVPGCGSSSFLLPFVLAKPLV